MNESDLPARLRSAADTVQARPDLAEVELGAGRVRGRRRVATGVVAAMLVAGAGGAGFGLGRAVSDDADTLASATEPPAGEPSMETTTTLADRPATTVLPTPADIVAAESASDEPVPAIAADESFIETGYFPAELGLVYERTVLDGIRVRVQRGGNYETFEDDSGWQPAHFCYPTGEGRVTFAGPDIVDVGWWGWYTELLGEVAIQPTGVGWADGRPLRAVVVQASPNVTEVAITWPDGAADRAPVVGGIAVLVAEGEEDYSASHRLKLQVVTAEGTRDLTPAELDPNRDPDWRAACQPAPPALPAAGEPPADPAAAEAALRDRFDLIWDRSVPLEDKPGLLDDRTGIDAATEQVYAGSLAESADSAVHVIEELVFTSPTQAWFRYGIDTINGYFGDRFGYADLVDGVWVFPRDLVCQDLALAGGDCSPTWEPIHPNG